MRRRIGLCFFTCGLVRCGMWHRSKHIDYAGRQLIMVYHLTKILKRHDLSELNNTRTFQIDVCRLISICSKSACMLFVKSEIEFDPILNIWPASWFDLSVLVIFSYGVLQPSSDMNLQYKKYFYAPKITWDRITIGKWQDMSNGQAGRDNKGEVAIPMREGGSMCLSRDNFPCSLIV